MRLAGPYSYDPSVEAPLVDVLAWHEDALRLPAGLKYGQQLKGLTVQDQRETLSTRKVAYTGVDRRLPMIIDQFFRFEETVLMLHNELIG